MTQRLSVATAPEARPVAKCFRDETLLQEGDADTRYKNVSRARHWLSTRSPAVARGGARVPKHSAMRRCSLGCWEESAVHVACGHSRAEAAQRERRTGWPHRSHRVQGLVRLQLVCLSLQ